MLGQPVYFLTPDVVGVELKGRLGEGITATDLVLTVTEMLRKEKVVGKFVEFFGEGTASLAVPDRATIANMAPEYGATMGFFPVDEATVDYLRAHRPHRGRDRPVRVLLQGAGPVRRAEGRRDRLHEDRVARPRVDQALARGPEAPAGPHRDAGAQVDLHVALLRSRSPRTASPRSRPTSRLRWTTADGIDVGSGDVLIAAITSCTNTSNPGVLLAAGLLAKKAVERGLKVKPHIKTSLAPGSRVVTEYLTKAGLLPYLEKLGFDVAAYGCTTCIGNAGDLRPSLNEAITGNDLICAAVLSGNRNFEARIHPNLKANFLASPPLVVAYAIAGTVLKDLANDPVGIGSDGQPVMLKDLWPTSHEIAAVMPYATRRRGLPQPLRRPREREPAVEGHRRRHRPGLRLAALDLHREAAVLRRLLAQAAGARRQRDPRRARARHLRRLGHDRPHLAGRLDQADLARGPLPAGERRRGRRLQQLRRAARQPRGDDARHLRQRAHQEPDAAAQGGQVARGRRRHAVPAGRRQDADLRRGDEVHRGRRADRRVRRRGVRHRQLARLGGQGHAAPRREGGRSRRASSASTARNLVGMGVLPLQFKGSDSAETLGLAATRRSTSSASSTSSRSRT